MLHRSALESLYELKMRSWVKTDLTQIFKGKKVIIIGPADTANQYCTPEFVNQFDVVVRVNRSFPVSEENAKFTTNRCDVLFHSLVESGEWSAGVLDFKNLAGEGLKNLVFPISLAKHHKTAYKIKNRIPKTIGFYRPKIDLYKDMVASCAGFQPTTGFSAIYLSLKAQPAKVFITGFSFYQTAYAGSYRNEINNMNAWVKKINDKGDHNLKAEFDSLLKACKASKGVELDPFIDELFANPERVIL